MSINPKDFIATYFHLTHMRKIDNRDEDLNLLINYYLESNENQSIIDELAKLCCDQPFHSFFKVEEGFQLIAMCIAASKKGTFSYNSLMELDHKYPFETNLFVKVICGHTIMEIRKYFLKNRMQYRMDSFLKQPNTEPNTNKKTI